MTGKRIIKRFISAILVITVGLTFIGSVYEKKANANEITNISDKRVSRKAQNKNIAGYTIFTEKQINNRIKVIRDYYYNKANKLTVRKRKISGFDSNKSFTMQYYIHGRDLMFGYGSEGKTEYRLYFYNNQLVQMFVDKPGKPRKTYKQLYKRLGKRGEYSVYNNTLNMYMLQEGNARIEMDFTKSKIKKNTLGKVVLITKISGNTITYHFIKGYGPDGWIWSIGIEAYTTKLNRNVSIVDNSWSPETKVKRNMKWLRKTVAYPGIGLAVILSAKGKNISNILVPYFA